jgi:hypothetical protein
LPDLFDKSYREADDLDSTRTIWNSSSFAKHCCKVVSRLSAATRYPPVCHKVPACLSAIALLFITALALTSDFDERPRYARTILPAIDKAEGQFLEVMRETEREPTEPLRSLYFIEGHRRAKVVLQVLKSKRPAGVAGRKAQRELIRYYELLDEEFAIIRTEMSLRDSYDYFRDWKISNARLLPIRERWVKWARPGALP